MADKKKWKDLPVIARAAIITMGAAQVALLGAAHADISRRPAEQIRGSKMMWRLITLINTIGPILYFRCGRITAPADTDADETPR